MGKGKKDKDVSPKIRQSIDEIVYLYFQGFSVSEALKIVRNKKMTAETVK